MTGSNGRQRSIRQVKKEPSKVHLSLYTRDNEIELTFSFDHYLYYITLYTYRHSPGTPHTVLEITELLYERRVQRLGETTQSLKVTSDFVEWSSKTGKRSDNTNF